MIRLGRHPRALDIAAWFDGEGRANVGSHVARCSSCRHRVDRLAEVRSWVRSQPLYSMGAPEAVSELPQRPRRAVAIALAVATLALAIAVPRLSNPDTEMSSARRRAPDRAPAPVDPAPLLLPAELPLPLPIPPIDTFPLEHAPALAARADLAAAPPSSGPRAAAGRDRALRLGLVVPQVGPRAAEGDEVEGVVRDRVQVGNAEGGVAGFPIELTVVPAEDAAAVQAMVHQVDALVGGFGAAAPVGLPWLLPADPSVAGADVLLTEATSSAAGAQLATALRQRGLGGVIGVVVGPGPDAGFAEGLASRTSTFAVPSRDGTCSTEVAALQRARAEVLAIAGDSDLVASCMAAASRALWRPRLGIVLPPSAAYANVLPDPLWWGSRTVLALPWPTTSAPGAARFRGVSRATSYRSLVSFAAVELAIAVARRSGTISLPHVAAGAWPSDLLELSGTTSRGASVVIAGPESWIAEPKP